MHVFFALPYYLAWHYGIAYFDMKNIWKNFIVFIYDFFSLKTLLFSLFSPWHRMSEGYSKGFEGLMGTFIVNTLMRFVGAFVRLFFIISGLLAIFIIILVGIVTFILWTVLPFLLIYTLLQGIYLITS